MLSIRSIHTHSLLKSLENFQGFTLINSVSLSSFPLNSKAQPFFSGVPLTYCAEQPRVITTLFSVT